MSLLAPLYFFGALAIGLPILFHLIRRQPKGQVEFSSLMFLQATPPRLTRRSRLDNWPLLLLRALALMLLAAAFARPFLRSVALSESDIPGRRIVLLLDTSASMQRDGLWQQALDQAQGVLDDLQPADQLAIVTFDREPQTLAGFQQASQLTHEQTKTAFGKLIRATTPTWHRTDLGRAISFAGDLAVTYEVDEASAAEGGDSKSREAALPTGPAHLILISDLQNGSETESLQAYTWPRELRLDVRSVVPRRRTNAFARILQPGADANQDPDRVRVRVSNSVDADESRFRLRWDTSGRLNEAKRSASNQADAASFTASELPVQVPPGESRVVRMPLAPPGATSLLLQGDAHGFDNHQYVVSPQPETLSLWHVGNVPEDPRDSLFFYLQRVPLSNLRRNVSVESMEPGQVKSTLDPTQTPLVVLSDPVGQAEVSLLRQYIAAGGQLLVVLAEPSTAKGLIDNVNAIAGSSLGSAESEVKDYRMLSSIDFSHPLFESMSDPQFNDFSKIRFWSHRSLQNVDDVWKVAARFDNGDAALIDRSIGDGGLHVIAAGWQPKASQLALSTKFIPLVFSWFDVGRGASVANQYVLGQSVDFAPSKTATITLPAGTAMEFRSAADAEGIDQPGIYQFADGDLRRSFAVNLDESESHTAPMTDDELEQFGIVLGSNATTAQAMESQRQLRDRELEGRQRLWQWLLVAALGLLGLETFLGALWSRRPGREPAELEGVR